MPSETLVEDILGRLRQGGARVTTVRQLVVSALVGAGRHVTVDELENLLRAEGYPIGSSTVYRILDELERLGIVDHISVERGPAVYHLADGAHHHLVCTACGDVFTVPDDAFADLERALQARYRFLIDPRHLAVLGHCAACTDAQG